MTNDTPGSLNASWRLPWRRPPSRSSRWVSRTAFAGTCSSSAGGSRRSCHGPTGLSLSAH